MNSQFQKKRDELTRTGFPSDVVEIIHNYLPESANRPQFEEKMDNLIWIGFPPDVAQNVINFLPSTQLEQVVEPNSVLFDPYYNSANRYIRSVEERYPTAAVAAVAAAEPNLFEIPVHENADSICNIMARGGSVERNRFKTRNNKIR